MCLYPFNPNLTPKTLNPRQPKLVFSGCSVRAPRHRQSKNTCTLGVAQFSGAFCTRTGQGDSSISRKPRKLLCAYHHRCNVRFGVSFGYIYICMIRPGPPTPHPWYPSPLCLWCGYCLLVWCGWGLGLGFKVQGVRFKRFRA